MREERTLKVYAAPGKVIDIPQIRIQGKWLRDIGYETGDEIIVKALGPDKRGRQNFSRKDALPKPKEKKVNKEKSE